MGIQPQRLGRAARKALARVDTGHARAWIPSIVAIELTLLQEAGRRVLTVADVHAATKRNGEVRILPHDLRQATEFALLIALADPFDRIIVAAARAIERPLITADEDIRQSGLVDVVWE